MAKEDIRTYSLKEIMAMRARGEVKKTPRNAPTYEPEEGFWEKARLVVEARRQRKASVHLRIDPETLALYRAAGRGHLTRMANILKIYADTQIRPHIQR